MSETVEDVMCEGCNNVPFHHNLPGVYFFRVADHEPNRLERHCLDDLGSHSISSPRLLFLPSGLISLLHLALTRLLLPALLGVKFVHKHFMTILSCDAAAEGKQQCEW